MHAEGEAEGEGYALMGVGVVAPHGGGADFAAKAQYVDGGCLLLGLLPSCFLGGVCKLGTPFQRVVDGGEFCGFEGVLR